MAVAAAAAAGGGVWSEGFPEGFSVSPLAPYARARPQTGGGGSDGRGQCQRDIQKDK